MLRTSKIIRSYIFPLLATILSTVSLQAQDSSYEAWANKKRTEYERWKKMRAEIASRLPPNANMDAVSSFIDQGFAPHSVQPAQTAATTQPAQPAQSTAVQPASGVQPAVPAQPVLRDMKIWVVIVGVANYIDARIDNLNYTDDDAYKMYAFYKSPEGGSLPDRQITLLIDEDATRSRVLTAANEAYLNAGKEDAIIFYFSGHGSEDAFLTHELDGKRDTDGGYRGLLMHDELHEVFRKSPAKYKYIIADACHSGSSAGKSVNNKNSKPYYQTFENIKGGFVMLLSSMSDEVSVETSGVRQGVFSHYLLRGIKGEADNNKDYMVSVTELFDFVESRVKYHTRNKQNPVMVGDYNDVLPVSILPR